MNKISEQEQLHVFTSFPDTAVEEENVNLLENDSKSQLDETPKYSFWQIEFYQKYFNITSSDVLHRILGSMIPRPNSNYLTEHIRPNPDLYGPFWICITLIFTIAISGNILNFFSHFGHAYTWQTDFHKVTTSAFTILFYWWTMPTCVYLLARWRQNKAGYSYLEMLCVYGYSLSIYIPISILWLVNISFLQWFFVMIAMVLSGTVLVLTFYPAFKEEKLSIYGPILGGIFLLHGLLAIGFMLYFFHMPSINPSITTTAPGP